MNNHPPKPLIFLLLKFGAMLFGGLIAFMKTTQPIPVSLFQEHGVARGLYGLFPIWVRIRPYPNLA